MNPAGKYVLFGEDGKVVRKAGEVEVSAIGEDYTGTETVPAIIALRAETFEGFHGTVQIVLEEKSGMQKTVELNNGNFFSMNVGVNSGTYTVCSADAKTDEVSYVVELPTAPLLLPEQGIRVLKVSVTGTQLEVSAEDKTAQTESPEAVTEDKTAQAALQGSSTEEILPQEEKTKDTELQTGRTDEQPTDTERKEDAHMQDMELKKVAAVFDGIVVVCLAGILLLYRKCRKYN